jgi:hypothetical protein
MKLKKASIYLLSFALLCVMFSACYYLSYMHALDEFNKRAIEHKDQLYALAEDTQPQPTEAAEDDNTQDSVSVLENDITVKPETKYTLEIYDMKTDTLDTQELNPPADLVGLTREEIVTYLSNYMDDMPLSEYNKGLISYELIYFSEDEIIIKKTYNEDFIPCRYYVAVKDGYVVVYNSDLKSIFQYTQIEAKNLPEDDRIALSKGIYVNNKEELYSLLESYSS